MITETSGRILYCDAACVVVNKIAGEAVEGAGRGMADLPRLLAAELVLPNWPQALPAKDALVLPTAAHRIDVPVSGCVLFGRTGSALRFLNNGFSDNVIKKQYWAIIEAPQGNADTAFSENDHASVELIHWIQFDSRRNKSIAHNEPGPGRKKAVLHYRLAGRGRDYLFLEVELITGRHHQIRAQFERLGLHIKGDLKYGARRSEQNGGIRLHARSLSFPKPENNGSFTAEQITVQADPPLRDNLWRAFEEAVHTQALLSRTPM